MNFILRNYQETAVQESIKFLNSHATDSSKRLLWAAPTGSGKSLVELAILKAVPGSWLITPRVEIIVGMLEKLGFDYISQCSEKDINDLAFKHRIGTPIKLANRWMAGELQPPTALILDESHHDNSESWQNIHAMTLVPAVGFTATPYRGTPQETALLRKRWGEPRWMITYNAAEMLGHISLPYCSTEPLVDDDVIKIQGGEFGIKSLNTESLNRIEDAARFIERYFDPVTRTYDRPTLVSVPSSVVAEELAELVPSARVVTADTSKRNRQTYFRETEARACVLIHINVVSEGVDLKLRRLIDFSPTLSPVKWCQQVGRITRPVAVGENPPEYICLNRNLLRHAYILAGALPNAKECILEAEQKFGGMGKRPSGGRVFGTENLGRLQGVEVKLLNGLTGIFYAFSRTVNTTVENYSILFHPLQQTPIWAKREDRIVGSEPIARVLDNGQVISHQTPTREWGKWETCEPLSENVVGFSSLPSRPPSEKQLSWYMRDAERFGLLPVAPSNKQFQVLPVLKDLGIRVV